MTGRLILHIGLERCGALSVQRALIEHATSLNDQGFRVIANGRPRGPSTGKFKITWRDHDDSGWGVLRDELAKAKSDGHNLILSDETLWRAGSGQPLNRVREMAEGFDIVAIVYVEEQGAFVQSLILNMQKKHEKAFDLSKRGAVDRVLKRRNLNYYQLCKRTESSLGQGTVNARLITPSSLVGGSVATDFFHTIGVEQTSRAMLEDDHPPALTPEFAEVLRLSWPSTKKEFRYGELLDMALRLSANGNRFFLSEAEAEILRSRYEVSNLRFAQRYLRNATELPLGVVWESGNRPSSPIPEMQERLHELARHWALLGSQWSGANRPGKRVFAEGWRKFLDLDNNLYATPLGSDCVVRFRTPVQRLNSAREDLHVSFTTTQDEDYAPNIEVNGVELGSANLAQETLCIPKKLANEFGGFELTFRNDSHSRVRFSGIDVDADLRSPAKFADA